MATLMPYQDYPGGWVPPGSQSSIVVIYIDDVTPYLSLFVPYGGGINGGGTGSYPPHNVVTIPTWRNMNTGANIETIKVTLPPGRRYEVQTYDNNFANNRDYKDIVIGDLEYVPINESYSTKEWAWWLPAEGVGALNGAHHIVGSIQLDGNNLSVSGVGRTNAQYFGRVDFWQTATILINDREVTAVPLQRGGEQVALNPGDIYIGTTNINLPEPMHGQKTSLVLTGNYVLTTDTGTTGPLFPSKYGMDIQIRERLKPEEEKFK